MRSYFLIATTIAFAVNTPMVFAENRDGPHQEAIEQEAIQDCDANQTNMNLCSYRGYKALDDELNLLYKAQLERLKGTKDAKRLINAQKAWLKYIEADCLYQNGPREESGTIWPRDQNWCLSDHLRQRIKLLNLFLDCTDNGCPGR
jgi:uncharacterized protein YecT (DUF1311 family)